MSKPNNKYTFVGYTKRHDFTNGGSVLKISLNADDLKTLTNNQNEKGYVNLVVSGIEGDKPYMYIDTWKPQPKAETADANGDLPF